MAETNTTAQAKKPEKPKSSPLKGKRSQRTSFLLSNEAKSTLAQVDASGFNLDAFASKALVAYFQDEKVKAAIQALSPTTSN